MRTPADLRAAAAALALALAAPLHAQLAPRPGSAAAPAAGVHAAALPAGDVYRREVFSYQRGGRPDPFQPLLTAAELGFRVEDLRLTSIIYSPETIRSVAVFAEGDSARRYRMHQGQKLGTMTVLRIYPNRVDVRVDEFGGSHLQSIPLVRQQRIEAAAAQAGGGSGNGLSVQPQGSSVPITITTTNQPQQPAGPRVLRRGSGGQPRAQTGTAAPASTAPRPVSVPVIRSTPYSVSPR